MEWRLLRGTEKRVQEVVVPFSEKNAVKLGELSLPYVRLALDHDRERSSQAKITVFCRASLEEAF
jgi:hypothetical protein